MAIEIAIGQQLSFWPFLQLNVEMTVKEKIAILAICLAPPLECKQ
jgi:hypothetical protein